MSEDAEFLGGKRKLVDTSLVILFALTAAAGVAVWVLRGPQAFWAALGQDLFFMAILLPKIAGGVLIAVLLQYVLPKKRMSRLVGPESGWRGLALAALVGAVVPGGPSITFPLVIGLMAAGADVGAAVAMVSGWLLLNVSRTLIWELSFLPADVVALRIMLSLALPVLLGALVRRIAARQRVAS